MVLIKIILNILPLYIFFVVVGRNMAYYDSSSSAASSRKYKYAATSDLEMDDSSLRAKKGYWVYANQSGNLTLPAAAGGASSSSGQTYQWNKLRFANGTVELNITQASNSTNAWISNVLYYYGCDSDAWLDCNTNKNHWQFLDIQGSGGIKNNISSWEGVFVYSYKNNITLIRQN